MQLVSREVLFDVMAHKKPVHLSESESSAFQEFCKKATNEYEKAHEKYFDAKNADLNEMDYFTNAMLQYMKDNISQIRYVGQGSSRIVYAMADGTALKIAKTRAGIAQNKQEAKNCMKPDMKYAIFPDFYGADTSKWLTLNCELCAKAKKIDFKDILQIQPFAIVEIFQRMVLLNFSSNPADMLRAAADYYFKTSNQFYAMFIDNLIEKSKTNEAFKALMSLLEYYAENGPDGLILDDFEEIENWGITVRNGQKVLVIIDAGFSEDVYQKHYKQT